MGLPVIPASGPTQVDTNPPSEIEVMREIGFLRSYEATGPERLSLSFPNDGGVDKIAGASLGKRGDP